MQRWSLEWPKTIKSKWDRINNEIMSQKVGKLIIVLLLIVGVRIKFYDFQAKPSKWRFEKTGRIFKGKDELVHEEKWIWWQYY